ncbi:unnamed protein product [Cercopithifilaria johnstoni]|uniref:Uncharacterized protein n=1 Tax=Cercopithifilaria johnstoni TaxID=2874296 RepID=A0A8J2PSC2_9BILA|nr:unnamed protein product [Cercopithifilaria johnstoni]
MDDVAARLCGAPFAPVGRSIFPTRAWCSPSHIFRNNCSLDHHRGTTPVTTDRPPSTFAHLENFNNYQQK